MCGRIVQQTNPSKIAEQLMRIRGGLDGEFRAHYNIPPTLPILAIRPTATGAEWMRVRWGMIPRDSQTSTVPWGSHNAMGEKVHTTAAYQQSFKDRRCIVPIDGFYEWRVDGARKKPIKTPFFIHRSDNRQMVVAGLWDRWEKPGGTTPLIESCTIITTSSNPFVAYLHDRMPCMLEAGQWESWLDPATSEEELLKLVVTKDWKGMEMYEVERAVNKTGGGPDGPECIEPINQALSSEDPPLPPHFPTEDQSVAAARPNPPQTSLFGDDL